MNPLILCILIIFSLVGCVSAPPIMDYTIARSALESARGSDAPRLSSGFWNKAEELFRMGEESFNNKDFSTAKELFIQSIEYSEKSENSARQKKFESGDYF